MADRVEEKIARIVYWDACGTFFVEILNGFDVPLVILEELILESKKML